MKPDEDYEDLEQNTYVGKARAMSWIVLVVAIGGFATLAYYAYHSASEATGEVGSTVIEADTTPYKEIPADPEGEQFANKDKTIYDVIAPDGSKQTEKLMPEPERPVAAADTEDEDSIAASQEPTATTAPAPAEPAKAEAKPEPVAAKPAAEPAKAPVAAESKLPAPVQTATTTYVAEDRAAQMAATAPAPSKPEAPSYASPTMVNEKTVTGKAAEVKAPAKPSEPKVKPAASASSSSGYKIQLGAYGSEVEAQGAWKKISGKYAGVLTGAPTIVKAEVNGKTFYRLRTGSFASSDAAKAECTKLAGQACMAVK